MKFNLKWIIPVEFCCIGIPAILLVLIIGLSIAGRGLPLSGLIELGKSLEKCYLNNLTNPSPELSNAQTVIQKVASSKSTKGSAKNLRKNQDYISKVLQKSRQAGVNPAILLGIWFKEQKFAIPDNAPVFGVLHNTPKDFDTQLDKTIQRVLDTENNRGNYTADKYPELPKFQRFAYIYTPPSDPANKNDYANFIKILQVLTPDQIECPDCRSTILSRVNYYLQNASKYHYSQAKRTDHASQPGWFDCSSLVSKIYQEANLFKSGQYGTTLSIIQHPENYGLKKSLPIKNILEILLLPPIGIVEPEK